MVNTIIIAFILFCVLMAIISGMTYIFRKQEKETKLQEAERAKILSQAELHIDNDNYGDAAAMYKKAAEISKMLEEEDKAKIFIKRAEEILVIEKNLKKRMAEEKEKRKMQEKRALLEAERSQAITRAEQAMEKGVNW